jgi:CBS domain-containing protein
MEETGSYNVPSVEHARVRDAMNKAIVTCSPDAGLREMGRLMASHHIHSLVMSLGDPAHWGVVSDVDIALAALSRPEATAEDLAVPATSIPRRSTADACDRGDARAAHLAPDCHRHRERAADWHHLGARHRRHRRLGRGLAQLPRSKPSARSTGHR